MSPWSLHQDAAERATSYFKQTGPTLPAKALAFATSWRSCRVLWWRWEAPRRCFATAAPNR